MIQVTEVIQEAKRLDEGLDRHLQQGAEELLHLKEETMTSGLAKLASDLFMEEDPEIVDAVKLIQGTARSHKMVQEAFFLLKER